jgi:hypothetical protein
MVQRLFCAASSAQDHTIIRIGDEASAEALGGGGAPAKKRRLGPGKPKPPVEKTPMICPMSLIPLANVRVAPGTLMRVKLPPVSRKPPREERQRSAHDC